MQTGIIGAPDVCHQTHYLKPVVCPWAVPEVFTLPFDNLSSQHLLSNEDSNAYRMKWLEDDMKPRVSSIVPSIHFHDVLSSYFSKQARFSIFLDVHADQLDCLAKLPSRDYSSILCILKSFKGHSPRTLMKVKILSRPLCAGFFFFSRSFSGLKGKTQVGQSIYNQGLLVTTTS